MEFAKISWIIFLIFCIDAGEAINNKNEPSYLIPCEKGWFFFGEKCYKVIDKTKGLTWKLARDSCSKRHGSLVTIQSRDHQDFLDVFLLLDVKMSLWIGLNDRDKESQFIWDDGSTVNYTNWDIREPSGSVYRNEDCVEMIYSHDKIGKWNDLDCSLPLPYICQSNKSHQSLNLDPRFCTDENDGAWNYLNSCYHTIDEEMTWDDAENYCQDVLKGHLLSMHNFNTDKFLKYVLSNFKKKFWIGIKIQQEDAELNWTMGYPVKFKKWENKRKRLVNGSCAFMTTENVWNSGPCTEKLPFVCETSKHKPPELEQAPEGWRCPELVEDWIDLGGDTCYIFETRKPRKWLEASFACSKKGGNLASIHSVAETNAIHPLIIGVHAGIYIGLHRSWSNNSVFEWADGTMLDYQNWKVGEPNSNNEACGEIAADDMIWNDVSCDSAKGYICSAKKVPPAEISKSTFKDGQHLVEADGCSSGNVPSNTMLAVLFLSISVSFVAGFTISRCRDHYRTGSKQCWNYFSLIPGNKKESSELTELNRSSEYGRR